MIEPTRVIPAREAAGPDEPWEDSLGLFRPDTGSAPHREDGPDTQPLPRTEPPPRRVGPHGAGPQPAGPPRTEGRATRPRRSTRALRIAALTGTGGAVGFALAFALLSPGPGPGTPRDAAPAAPGTPTAAAPAAPATGILREGDSGPAVSELQARLLRIPDVYAGGAVDGRFDGRLAAAVARFQVWYGVRGDESGEYGDATRRDLESRTSGLASG
ncbi:peptidoglycan-binding domain-containing protein [Streptomyces sp. NPDC001070]